MLVDTHCHLTYDDLSTQADAVLARAAEAGVQRLITVATTPADARRAQQLLAGRPQVFLAAGIHPHEAAKVTDDDLAFLGDLHDGRVAGGGLFSRLVAVGETGLDFHYDFATPERQEAVFRWQLELACRVGRPVIIHAREAERRVCEVLADYPALAGRAVFHCFSGDVDLARTVLDGGHWLSFTGVVTFRNAEPIRETVRFAPADRIMLETDAPYLSPEPVRKVRPCEPAFVAHTARLVAQLRGLSELQLAALTTANAERFFGLSMEGAS